MLSLIVLRLNKHALLYKKKRKYEKGALINTKLLND